MPKKIIFIVLVLGTLATSFTMLKSGLSYDFGLGFWGPNGHDAIWHLSVIHQIQQDIPPNNPIYSGEKLTNYHWGYDFFLALISKLTSVSSSALYFQIMPLLISILIGLLSFIFAYIVTKNKTTSTLFVIFNYFASSLGWLFGGGESFFWAMQSISYQLNPPFALSLVFLLLFLIIFYFNLKHSSIKNLITMSLLIALLTVTKVYAAIILLSSLLIYSIFNHRKILPFVLSSFLIFAFSLLVIGVSLNNSLLTFSPFWFANTLIEDPTRLYLPKISSFIYNISNQSFSLKTVILLVVELVLTAVFLLGNLGIRILGLFEMTKNYLHKKTTDIDILLFFSIIISATIPLLFIQKGTSWNTIQFFYYALFLLNFYTAKYFSSLKNRFAIPLITFLIIVFCLIPSFQTLKDYFGYPPPSALPTQELKALEFLKNKPSGYVLTYPYDKFKKDKIPTPLPLYLYETTAYVSAFSHKPVFLEDEMNLDITGFNWKKRRQEVLSFFNSFDRFQARGFLLNNKISYIYLTDNQQLPYDTDILQISQIFQSANSRVYQVQK